MYDIIVTGNGPGSVFAALLCSRAGKRTLLVCDARKRALSQSGYVFDADPFSWSLNLRNGALKAFLSELPDLLICNPGFQVILDDCRVDFFSDRDRLFQELNREFPAFQRIIENIYESYTNGYNLLDSLIGQRLSCNSRSFFTSIKERLLPVGHKFRSRRALLGARGIKNLNKLITAQILSHSKHFPVNAADANLLFLAGPGREFIYPRGGKCAIYANLLESFIKSGGQIVKGAISELATTKKLAKIRILKDGEADSIQGRAAFLNCSWPGPRFVFKNGKYALAEQGRETLYPFSIHLGVRENSIPELLAPYATIFTENSAIGCIFLEISASADRARAPESKRALTATILLPHSKIKKERLKEVADNIISNLEGSFLAFIREGLDFFNPDASIEFFLENMDYSAIDISSKRAILPTAFPLPQRRSAIIESTDEIREFGFSGELISGILATKMLLEAR